MAGFPTRLHRDIRLTKRAIALLPSRYLTAFCLTRDARPYLTISGRRSCEQFPKRAATRRQASGGMFFHERRVSAHIAALRYLGELESDPAGCMS
jgi:hypothetical protein